MSAPGEGLSDRVLLVVEDEYLVAAELVEALEGRGATVVGPAPDVPRALRLLASTARVDGALLDIQLRGNRVFAIAEALRTRAIPFIFVSGLDPESLPEAWRDVPVLTKPLDLDAVATALARARRGEEGTGSSADPT